MIIPRTKWVTSGLANGSNNLFGGVTMKRGIAYGAAIYAQEVAEWNRKFNHAAFATPLALGLSAALVLFAGLPWFFAAIPVVAVPMLAVRFVGAQRAFEYWGKAVEWRAAVRMGAESESYLRSEALSLALYDAHRGDPIDTAIAGIRANEAKADAWLDKHWSRILTAYGPEPAV